MNTVKRSISVMVMLLLLCTTKACHSGGVMSVLKAVGLVAPEPARTPRALVSAISRLVAEGISESESEEIRAAARERGALILRARLEEEARMQEEYILDCAFTDFIVKARRHTTPWSLREEADRLCSEIIHNRYSAEQHEAACAAILKLRTLFNCHYRLHDVKIWTINLDVVITKLSNSILSNSISPLEKIRLLFQGFLKCQEFYNEAPKTDMSSKQWIAESFCILRDFVKEAILIISYEMQAYYPKNISGDHLPNQPLLRSLGLFYLVLGDGIAFFLEINRINPDYYTPNRSLKNVFSREFIDRLSAKDCEFK